MKNNNGTKEENILDFDLYSKIPFAKINANYCAQVKESSILTDEFPFHLKALAPIAHCLFMPQSQRAIPTHEGKDTLLQSLLTFCL